MRGRMTFQIAAALGAKRYCATIGKAKDRYKKRRSRDRYNDFALLPQDTSEAITVFASDKYIPLLNALASSIRAEKTVFYNTGAVPVAPGCELVKFHGSRSTNWQYDCANAFLDGALSREA